MFFNLFYKRTFPPEIIDRTKNRKPFQYAKIVINIMICTIDILCSLTAVLQNWCSMVSKGKGVACQRLIPK